MEFRTKREAEDAAQDAEAKADSAARSAKLAWEEDGRGPGVALREAAHEVRHRAEAARIRALLPTLPD